MSVGRGLDVFIVEYGAVDLLRDYQTRFRSCLVQMFERALLKEPSESRAVILIGPEVGTRR